MMGTMVDHLVDQFQTAELVLVAEYLGMAPVSDWGSRRVVDAITRRLEDGGVPALPVENDQEDLALSLVRDYLYVAEYEEGVADVEQKQEGGGEKPKCFSLADDLDPACCRCSVFDECAAARLANLPPCFGVAFDSAHPECEVCIEASYCRKGK